MLQAYLIPQLGTRLYHSGRELSDVGDHKRGHIGESETYLGSEGLNVFSSGRVFDLIVVGRPSDDPGGPRMSTFEDLLFESGRPILLAPPIPPAHIGRNVLIAWNCSTEQARATASAMPFLSRAERITIIVVDGATVPGPSAGEMAKNLKLHGSRPTL